MSRMIVAGVIITLALAAETAEAQRRLDSGLHELVVIEPDTNENGRPTVGLNPSADGMGLEVDVDRTVHVHVNYYSGKRDFHGPIVSGGPVLVVCNHPTFGDKVYIPLSLPEGSPLIRHRASSIEYVYDEERVQINFNRRHPERANIKHIRGQGFTRVVKDHTIALYQGLRERMRGSAALTSIRESASEAAGFFRGSAAVVDDGLSQFVGGIQSLGSSLPGVSSLVAAGEDRATDQSVEVRNEILQQGRDVSERLRRE